MWRRNEGWGCTVAGTDCQGRMFYLYCKGPGVPREAPSDLCLTLFGVKFEDRGDWIVQAPCSLASESLPCLPMYNLRRINQGKNVTWVLAGSPLLSLREGGISGCEDIKVPTTHPQLGSVSLGQGSQPEGSSQGPG